MDRKMDERGWIFSNAKKYKRGLKCYIFVTMSFYACNQFSEAYNGLIDCGNSRVESETTRGDTTQVNM